MKIEGFLGGGSEISPRDELFTFQILEIVIELKTLYSYSSSFNCFNSVKLEHLFVSQAAIYFPILSIKECKRVGRSDWERNKNKLNTKKMWFNMSTLYVVGKEMFLFFPFKMARLSRWWRFHRFRSTVCITLQIEILLKCILKMLERVFTLSDDIHTYFMHDVLGAVFIPMFVIILHYCRIFLDRYFSCPWHKWNIQKRPLHISHHTRTIFCRFAKWLYVCSLCSSHFSWPKKREK